METWNYGQGGNVPSAMIQGMLGAAFITKQEEERLKSPEVQEEMNAKLTANAKQMQAMAEQMQQEVNKNGKVPSAANMQKISDMLALMHKAPSVMPNIGGKLSLETPLHANGPVMIDITYDGKKDAVAKDAIEYANYKLKMVMEKKR